MKIGNIELENNIFLAPMAGITDLPFRLLCKEKGAGLLFTEMVSAKALMYNDDKTQKLLKIEEKERPVAAQIFGHEIEAIEYAVKYLQDKVDIIDINMGCPAPKVTKNGDGSALLKDEDLIFKIVKTAVDASKIPITVKMRIGWDEENINGLKVAKIIEEAGASMITVHGRTRSQFYSGEADWDIIKKIKENANIPIIGNGDIRDEEIAKKRLEETKVDGILIGRSAIGNPWIFENINYYLKNGKVKEEISKKEKLETIKRHYEMEIKEKGEKTAINEMRKQVHFYVKNMEKASVFRDKLNRIDNKEEVFKYLDEFFNI